MWLWLLLLCGVIEVFVVGCEFDSVKFGNKCVINLLGLLVLVDEMIVVLCDVVGDEVVKLICYVFDECVEKIVGSWFGCWDMLCVEVFGLKGDMLFVDVICSYIVDEWC